MVRQGAAGDADSSHYKTSSLIYTMHIISSSRQDVMLCFVTSLLTYFLSFPGEGRYRARGFQSSEARLQKY